MILIVDEDAHITISKGGERYDSALCIEIGEHRGTVEQILVHDSKSIVVSLGPDGLRINI